MSYQCKWTKDQVARAKSEKLGLFAVACDRSACRFELTGMMDEARCALLVAFGQRLYRGDDPEAALRESLDALTDVGREMIAANTKTQPGEANP